MRVAVGCDEDDLLNAVFKRGLFERSALHLRRWSWRSSVAQLPEFSHTIATARYGACDEAVAEIAGCIARIRLHNGFVTVWLGAPTPKAAKAAGRSLSARLPALAPSRGVTPVTFWSHEQYGPERAVRGLKVARWADISANYPTAARAALEPLMRDFVPDAAGRLVLWHGPPGTGKTYAIRALAWEWRGWCDVHVVTDPETLLGGSPGYLLDVAGISEPDARRWRLVVLEDSGELLSAEAKSLTGQGLSRLLNLTDGLLGQECRTLVLITTNERLRTLHPAVSRPGRAAANVAFTAFPADEGAAWLAARAPTQPAPSGEATLAELYAISRGKPLDRPVTTTGFTGRG